MLMQGGEAKVTRGGGRDAHEVTALSIVEAGDGMINGGDEERIDGDDDVFMVPVGSSHCLVGSYPGIYLKSVPTAGSRSDFIVVIKGTRQTRRYYVRLLLDDSPGQRNKRWNKCSKIYSASFPDVPTVYDDPSSTWRAILYATLLVDKPLR